MIVSLNNSLFQRHESLLKAFGYLTICTVPFSKRDEINNSIRSKPKATFPATKFLCLFFTVSAVFWWCFYLLWFSEGIVEA